MFSKNNKFIYLFYTILLLVNFSAYADEVPIEIEQPRFTEKGLDQKSFEIKAEKGLRYKDRLKLFNVEGKFKTNKGIWIYLSANEGEFLQAQNIIKLYENVNFYTESGDEISSVKATFDMNTDLVFFESNVIHYNDQLIIKSDTAYARNNFDSLVYEGNINSEILK